MKVRWVKAAPRASAVVCAILGVTGCSNDFTRGPNAGGDDASTDGGADATTPRDPLPVGHGGEGDPDDGGSTSDALDSGNAGDAKRECAPAATEACAENDRGQPIPGLPSPARGICALGAKTCSSAGTWGPCVGAVGPRARDCESSADNDCDGKPDDTLDGVCECNAAHPSRPITGGPKNCQCTEACGADHHWITCTPPAACDCNPAETRACTGASGCAGGTQACAPDRTWGTCNGAPSKATYCLDHDGDTFCSASTACSTVCPGALAAEWKTGCATTDCDDSNKSVNPNARPSCKPANECHTGALSCSAAGNTCADTGTSVANRTACTAGVCNAGACAPCVTGDARCASNTPQTCNGGGQWVSGPACAAVATCSTSGSTAKCACPSGYTGDGTVCVATPVLVCTANGEISSHLALAGAEVAFATWPYRVDGGTSVDLDVCATSSAAANATVLQGTFQTRLGHGYPAVDSHARAGKFYVSASDSVGNNISSKAILQFLTASHASAPVPLTVTDTPAVGNSSFNGTLAVDAIYGYLFLETAAGLEVTTVPDPLPSQSFAPTTCMFSSNKLGALAAGGNRAVVFDGTAKQIFGVTAPACASSTSVANNVVEVDAIATDGLRVVFNDRSNTYSCPFAGCGDLSGAILAPNQGVVTSIALDDTNAYWVGPSGLVSCPKTGCPNGPRVLTNAATAPASVAVDATSVYYSKGSAIYRIAKQ